MTDWSKLTATELTLYTGAVIAVIGSVFTGIVSVVSALKVAKIEAHVNSEKTAAQGREVNLQNENKLLREQMANQKATADLLAQAAATRIADPIKKES